MYIISNLAMVIRKLVVMATITYFENTLIIMEVYKVLLQFDLFARFFIILVKLDDRI